MGTGRELGLRGWHFDFFCVLDILFLVSHDLQLGENSFKSIRLDQCIE